MVKRFTPVVPLPLVLCGTLLAILAAGDPPTDHVINVTADLAPPKNAYTGADIDAALALCGTHCTLQLQAATYDDVALTLTDPSSTIVPNGLRILGSRAGTTVLRAKVGYPSHPVIQVGNTAPPGIELAYFTCDGRRIEQPDSVRDDAHGRANLTFDACIRTASTSGHSRANTGHIHDLTVRNFVVQGIVTQDVDGWLIDHNTISGIGCTKDSLGNRCSPSMEALSPIDSTATKLTNGFCVNVIGPSANMVIRSNTATFCTKMGFQTIGQDAKSGACISSGHLFDSNVAEDTDNGFSNNGGCNTTFSNNISRYSGRQNNECPRGCIGRQGFICAGQGAGNRWIGNEAHHNDEHGFSILCESGPIEFRNNRSHDNCQQLNGLTGVFDIWIGTWPTY